MYKIYINKTVIQFAPQKDVAQYKVTPEHLVGHYHGRRTGLLNYIDSAEKSERLKSITLLSEDLEGLINDFFSFFKLVEAAGGLVFNPQKELLAIFRIGMWDLPKGKIETGETPDVAAVREVQEETGIKNIRLGELLHTSYHTYRNRKGKRCLKPTFWYEMFTNDVELTPQGEEDIEQAIWVSKEAFLGGNYPTYGSILDVLDSCD